MNRSKKVIPPIDDGAERLIGGVRRLVAAFGKQLVAVELLNPAFSTESAFGQMSNLRWQTRGALLPRIGSDWYNGMLQLRSAGWPTSALSVAALPCGAMLRAPWTGAPRSGRGPVYGISFHCILHARTNVAFSRPYGSRML